MFEESDFKKNAGDITEWIASYFQNIEQYPVKSQCKPGDILQKLPEIMPEKGEEFKSIFEDFQSIILPGITHWQSPDFFAYFPANSSLPSVYGEMLMAALGVQAMKWETSPAAAELEERVMEWLQDFVGLPKGFTGVIQDTASTATLVAILSAREAHSGFSINREGLYGSAPLRVYCSAEAHSSIEKAVRIAGIGSNNLVKIDVDREFAMMPEKLEHAIKTDLEKGYEPLCVVSAFGTTGSTAIDPLSDIGEICKRYHIWHHVDAAYSGSALILPEMREMKEGLESADSFVFNPHKWLFTNFDCSAYFVKDKNTLVKTFTLVPEYLKTRVDDQVNNYCDWGIQLGRRFRALKLWFVLRSFGKKGLIDKIRLHLALAKSVEKKIKEHPDFEILAQVHFSLVCFRYHPSNVSDEDQLNAINEDLLHRINATGKIYLTHTKLNGKYTLRMVIAQTNVNEKHVNNAWDLIVSIAAKGK